MLQGLSDAAWPDYLGICVLRSRVFGADMGGKFFIALPLVDLLHLREGVAGERPRRFEQPPAFGAAAALKTRSINPYLGAARGHHWMSPAV